MKVVVQPSRPQLWRRIPPVYVILVVITVVAWILVELYGRGSFFGKENIANILQRSVSLGIVSVGQTFTILAGSLDLSVANMISVSAVMSSYIMQGDPSRVPFAIATVVLIGVIVGLVNGLLITQLRVNPLISTLGTGLLLQGILSASFRNFAGSVPEQFQVLAYGSIGPISYSVLMFIIIASIGVFILRKTRFGAHLYAVGGSQEVSRLSGLRTTRVLLGAHVIASLTAVITGIYLASRLGAGAPWVGRDGVYDLESIAVVVIGGTALAGGRGGVMGTVAGVLIFAILDSMFNLLGVGSYLKQVLRGLIIIAAVASYSIRTKEEVS